MKNNSKKGYIILATIIVCAAILPLIGTQINTACKGSYVDQYRNTRSDIARNIDEEFSKKIESKMKSTKNKRNMMVENSESKNIKIKTGNIENGAGNVAIEITDKDEKSLYTLDIRFEENKWIILDKEKYAENEELMKIINELSEKLENLNTENISFNYSYKYNYVSSKSK